MRPEDSNGFFFEEARADGHINHAMCRGNCPLRTMASDTGMRSGEWNNAGMFLKLHGHFGTLSSLATACAACHAWHVRTFHNTANISHQKAGFASNNINNINNRGCCGGSRSSSLKLNLQRFHHRACPGDSKTVEPRALKQKATVQLSPNRQG
jgi:hypothetical protein